MSQPAENSPRGTNLLEGLDRQVPSSFYWSLTLLATLGGFLFGYDTSNIGSALNFVPYHLAGLSLGYLVSGASLGAAAGAIFAGPLTDRLGRKALLVADALIYAIGAVLSALTPDAAVLLAARTFIGVAIGADSAIATAYIAEYAPSGKRGALSMLQQWMITVGILLAYIVALVVFRVAPGSATTIDWRLILGLGAVPALVGLFFRARMPESPRWLLRHGDYDKAQHTFERLGIRATLEDVRQTARSLQSDDRHQSLVRRKSWTPGVRRAIVVVSVFFIFQQITGINVPLYYGPHLLGSLFAGHSHAKVTTTIAGVEVTAIMTTVNVAATYLGFRFIDRLGRRKMAMSGYVGMAVFAVISAFGLGVLGGTARTVVSMLGLSLFIASFAVGVGGTGWLVQGESFPTAVRGEAASIGATCDWLANFALVELFPTWQSGIGLPWVMVCFAALCLVALAFVYRFLPETKGRSVEEIVSLYEDRAQAGADARSETRSGHRWGPFHLQPHH
jgi:sugar porter (SP) family MFS transporter